MEKLTISGYSTALFSTWFLVSELGVLFDCGDGVTASLLQKTGKVKHTFISHSDRDHLGGLLRFCELNARSSLQIHYPKDCGSFPALASFSEKFDPSKENPKWIPLEDRQEITIRNDMVVRCQENSHIVDKGDQLKSLSYFVERVSRKLRPEFVGLSGDEISRIRKSKGDDAITEQSRKTILAYSGDTPIELDGRWDDAESLIHEATFLTADEIDPDNNRRNKHCSLEQILEVVATSRIKRLILSHFSSRYDEDQIVEAVKSNCHRLGITIPVYCLLPGRVEMNILANQPVNT